MLIDSTVKICNKTMFLKKYSQLSLLIFALCLLFSQVYSGHIHPYRSFYHEFAMTAGIFVAFIPLFFAAKEKLVFPAISLLSLSLMAWIGLQAVLGVSALAAIYYPLFVLLAVIFAMGLGASWVKQAGNANQIAWMFAWVYLFAALVSTLMQQVQILGFDWRPWVMYITHDGVNAIRPFANVAQPNQLALLICFGIASLWWMLQNSRISGRLAWALTVFLLWGLVLTQSRIAWIISPVFAALAWYLRRDSHPVSVVGVGSLLIIYVVLLLSLPAIAQTIGFVSGSIVERVGGRSERTVLLQQAWLMASTHPWMGVGWFGFGAQQVALASQFSPSTYAEHSHNIVLNFAAELGIPFSLFFFACLLVFVWKTCVSNLRQRDPSVIFMLMMLIAVAVHSLVEFPLWYAYVLLPVGVMLGALQQMTNPTRVLLVSQRTLAVSVLASLVILTWAWFDFHRVVDGFVAFRQAKNYESIPAEKISAPRWTLLPDYYDYFKLMRVVPVAGMSAEEITFVERVSLRFGYVHILSKLVEIYALNDRGADAKRVMRSLYGLHPWIYPEYYDYWEKLALTDSRFAEIFAAMPPRELH